MRRWRGLPGEAAEQKNISPARDPLDGLNVRFANDRLPPRARVTIMAGKTTGKSTARAQKTPKPRLLSGGNPQIAKGDGDAPIKAYIAALPGWKKDIGRRLDALITSAVPGVRKAVKWNSPFYGMEGSDGKVGWFVSFHCFTNYVKVTFYSGASLRPLPPGASKQKDVRYLDIHEDGFDEAQVARWVKQASRLPGWRM